MAYTLISAGFKIQYLGRMEARNGEMQIGARRLALGQLPWTVEQVRSLTKLPVDNEGRLKWEQPSQE